MPTISVIVPTYNRLGRLQALLAGLERQTVGCAAFEVLVVSDGSTDGTDEYLRNLETPLRLTPVFQPNSGVAATRNHGAQRAQGELIIFIDDDSLPVPELIEAHLAGHHGVIGKNIVLGPSLTPTDTRLLPWVRWEQAMLEKQYAALQSGVWEVSSRQFYTGNVSMARAVLLEVGGFDERFRRAEDVELGYRLAQFGVQFVFNPAAIVYHYAERSFASWLSIPYTYGRNDVIFARDKGQGWLLPNMFREFHDRNALVRSLTRAALDRSLVRETALRALQSIAVLADRLGRERLMLAAYSGIFNVRYYQGVADELGGRRRFFAGVDHARRERSDTTDGAAAGAA